MSQFEDIDDVTRALPHAVGPEKSVLSSILQEPHYFLALAIEENLSPEHFYLPDHSTLYGFLVELFAAGIEIELVSLSQRLLDRGLLDRVGGMATVAGLLTYSANPAHFRSHLKHVKDKFVLRALIQNANASIQGAYEQQEDVDALLDSAEAGMTAIRESRESVRISGIVEDVDRVLKELDDRIAGKPVERGMNTGFYKLDRMCGGLKPGEVFLVAARPGFGKTSFMMNIVEHCIMKENSPAGIFSCEMSAYELTQRLVHSMARFDSGMFRRGETPSGADLMRLRDAGGWVKQNHRMIRIDATPAITINQLRAKARRMKKEFGIKILGIDYVQLMKSKSKQAENSREREVAEISGGVKALAKELGIPIILLAQLNRDSEKRGAAGKDRRAGVPRVSDLRESGSLEADADLIGLLYRECEYLEGEAKELKIREADLFLSKNRSGDTGEIPLIFHKEYTRFETRYQSAEPSGPAPKEKAFPDF